MADPTEIEKLKAQIAELERRLVDEREEFQWDLKTRCESYERNIRRLEDENAQLKQTNAASSTEAAEGRRLRTEVEQYTQRTLKAERRVAELQEEIKRISIPVAPPIPRPDPALLKRVDEAERERDQLRQKVTRYEGELQQVRDELARQTRLGENEAQLRKELQQKDEAASRLLLEVKDKDQKLFELNERLQTLSTLDEECSSLRREVEHARSRNLHLEQMLAEREVSEQPERPRGYDNRADVTQPLGISIHDTGKQPEQAEEAVVAVVSEPSSEDELLPVISPDELYPDEASLPSLDNVPEQSPEESKEEPLVPESEAGAVISAMPTAAPLDSPPQKAIPPELEGMAEAWLVTDEPRQKTKPVERPIMRTHEDVIRSSRSPSLQALQVDQDDSLSEPIEQPQRRSRWKLLIPLAILVLLGAGLAGSRYVYPELFDGADWIAEASSWLADLGIVTSKSAPPAGTDARVPDAAATRGTDTPVVSGAHAQEKPASNSPEGTVPGAVQDMAGAGPANKLQVEVKGEPTEQPSAGSAVNENVSPGAKASSPVTETKFPPPTETKVEDTSTNKDSPSPERELSAGQRTARDNGLNLLNNKAWFQAEKDIGSALKKYPDDAVLHYLYGRVMVNTKELPKAAAAFEQVVMHDSSMADAYWELGKIYVALKQRDRAKAALEKFIQLLPDDTQRTPQAKALISKLR